MIAEDVALALVKLAVQIWDELRGHLSDEVLARIEDVLPERSKNDADHPD